jgi:hypothetical protein
MDLRDEVAGTEGTIWLDHFLRTGFEIFTAVGQGGYVAEKAEGDKGWLFPVGDEVHELGYVDMFNDMLDALDAGKAPMETLRDGYIVNAIIDACYKSAASKKWEPVELDRWDVPSGKAPGEIKRNLIEGRYVKLKEERLPNGQTKTILKDAATGEVIQRIKD